MQWQQNIRFQSTLPRRERPGEILQECKIPIDFNPRSREGSDSYISNQRSAHRDFNPRSREGSDAKAGLVYTTSGISIHAPAKGATQFPSAGIFPHIFQSTLPRRERQSWGCQRAAPVNFNPRSREGSDVFPPLQHTALRISIHAPAKGATADLFQSIAYVFISIHAPAKGATGLAT